MEIHWFAEVSVTLKARSQLKAYCKMNHGSHKINTKFSVAISDTFK